MDILIFILESGNLGAFSWLCYPLADLLWPQLHLQIISSLFSSVFYKYLKKIESKNVHGRILGYSKYFNIGIKLIPNELYCLGEKSRRRNRNSIDRGTIVKTIKKA